MVFSSTVFIFLFLPLVTSVYFLTPHRLKNYLLLFASLFFYTWGEDFFVFVLLLSITVNYAAGLAIDRLRGGRWARLVLVIVVALNLELLVLYKYSNFVIDNLSALLAPFGFSPIMLESRHLPIGISFFTFQAISYVVDVYRRDAAPHRNPFNVGLYIALFPQLIAGPIVRYSHIAEQLRHRTTSFNDVVYGTKRFIIGLGKKVIIANTVAVPVDAIFAIPAHELTTPLAWLGIVCYTLQIYFDFSGYSDMAIGLGRIFGFHFRENFQWPYVAQSVQLFWRRWHISLSTWFRDYVYVPLGGSRCSPRRMYVNLIAVFLLCGLWHGAAWPFVIWGLYHGAFLILERTRFGRWVDSLPRPLRHGYTLGVIVVGWVLFRSDTLSYALSYLAVMSGVAGGSSLLQPLPMYLTLDVVLAMIAGVVGAMPIVPTVQGWVAGSTKERSTMLWRVAQGAVVCCSFVAHLSVMFCCTVFLSAQTHNPFIYFRF